MEALQYQTVHANGIEFNVATAGAGRKLALCLHGFPESSFSWRYQMPLLAGMGYLVWAPDLRGYGKSTRPTGVSAYALEILEEDVAALIDASGAKEVVLIGHDGGALIAWHYALGATGGPRNRQCHDRSMASWRECAAGAGAAMIG
jgi:pimeloyl-ACP methyl ester carboxylesterase